MMPCKGLVVRSTEAQTRVTLGVLAVVPLATASTPTSSNARRALRVGGGHSLLSAGCEGTIGATLDGKGEKVQETMPNAQIMLGLGRCLLSASAALEDGVQHLLRHMSELDTDLHRGSEVNFSAATWHTRLGHVNAVDQDKLKDKGLGVDATYSKRSISINFLSGLERETATRLACHHTGAYH